MALVMLVSYVAIQGNSKKSIDQHGTFGAICHKHNQKPSLPKTDSHYSMQIRICNPEISLQTAILFLATHRLGIICGILTQTQAAESDNNYHKLMAIINL